MILNINHSLGQCISTNYSRENEYFQPFVKKSCVSQYHSLQGKQTWPGKGAFEKYCVKRRKWWQLALSSFSTTFSDRYL